MLYVQSMGIWRADLYATYATQSLPKKCKVFIFVQYIYTLSLIYKILNRMNSSI